MQKNPSSHSSFALELLQQHFQHSPGLGLRTFDRIIGSSQLFFLSFQFIFGFPQLFLKARGAVFLRSPDFHLFILPLCLRLT